MPAKRSGQNPVSFRLTDEAIDVLNQLTAETGQPRSAAVEFALRWMKYSMRQAIEWASQGPPKDDSKGADSDPGADPNGA